MFPAVIPDEFTAQTVLVEIEPLPADEDNDSERASAEEGKDELEEFGYF
jgi:hypothetical protein